MKDEQKSKALQACRRLLDAVDGTMTTGLMLEDIQPAVELARQAIGKKGKGLVLGGNRI